MTDRGRGQRKGGSAGRGAGSGEGRPRRPYRDGGRRDWAPRGGERRDDRDRPRRSDRDDRGFDRDRRREPRRDDRAEGQRPGRDRDWAPRGGERRDDRDRPRRSVQAPSQRQRTADPPRRAAFDLLMAVSQGAYANLALPAMLTERRISGRDAAFATELAYGTIRMQGQYDAVIGKVAGRDQIDPPVMNVLRLGLHQIAAMRVPDHAAVAATVAIAREAIGTGPGGFVNAILRAVTEASYQKLLDDVADSSDDSPETLAIRYAHPVWVVRALRQALIASGRDPADLPAVLAAANSQPPLTLAARPGLITPEELKEQVKATTKRAAIDGRWTPSAVILERGAPGDLPAVRRGLAGVQDEGSQLVAWALAGVPVEQDSGKWLDLCAGPGGKAALLGGIVRGIDGQLTANEPQPHRADLVRKAVGPLGRSITVTEEDGRELEGQYDRVLADVPCTGLGALRRRPEARWRHSPADLGTLGPLQRDLLAAAIRLTRPGGVVAYSTCSPHLAETRLVVEDVLKDHPEATIISGDELDVVPADAVGQDGLVQLWTDRHGTDAMFLALIRIGDRQTTA